MGLAYEKLEKWEDAIDCYKKAINSNPELEDAYNNLASVYFMLQKYSDSVKYYRQVIRKAPTSQAYCNLARALSNTSDSDEAAQCFKKAI